MKNEKYIDSLILDHREKIKKQKKTEDDRLEFSIISNFSSKSCHSYKLVNDYTAAFVKHKESRRKLLEEQKILSKVISIMLNENFEFINTADLLKFCYICVKDNHIDSTNFKSLILATYFKIIESELGSPSFESLKFIRTLLKIISIIRKRNNLLYFDWKVFKSFACIFQKNSLLYLEDQKVIEELIMTLINNYIEWVDAMIEYSEKAHLKVVKTSVVNSAEFFTVIYFAFKPLYLQFFVSNETFRCLLTEFAEQVSYITSNIKKYSSHHLKLFVDVILTFLFFYRYKSLRGFFNIDEERAAFIVLEYISVLLCYHKFQEINYFIERGGGLFDDLLRKQFRSLKVKKQFVSVQKEIELNMIKISSKEIAFKKSFLSNFCNKIFKAYNC